MDLAGLAFLCTGFCIALSSAVLPVVLLRALPEGCKPCLTGLLAR